MTTLYKSALVGALALTILLLGTGCRENSDDDYLLIGFIGPLSGDAASFGLRMRNAVEMAVEEFEGRLPIRVKLLIRDDAMEVSKANEAVSGMLLDDRIVAIIAAGRSQVVQMEAERTAPKGIIVISPTATSPQLSEAGAHFFRVIPSDAFQGKFLAECAQSLGLRRVSIIYLTDDYGSGLREQFRKVFLGVPQFEIPMEEGFRHGETEFEQLLLKVTSEGPDGVFVAGMPQEIADLLIDSGKIRDLSHVQFFAPEVFRSPDSLERAGEYSEGVLVSGTEVNLDQSFVNNYRAKFTRGNPDQEPDAFAANAYDSAKALLTAIEKGARTSKEIGGMLRSADFRFSGASGVVAFDPNGDIDTKNYQIYRVQKGKFIPTTCS